jgi:hypothetical protein
MRKIMAFVLALIVSCGMVSAQQMGGLPGVWAYGTADATAAYRIKYNGSVLKIDTSTALEYDAVSYSDTVSERWLSKIYGDPTGTGDVGVRVYIDQGSGYTLAYGKTITSPVYAFTQISSTTNTNTAINVVSVMEGFSDDAIYGLRVPQKAK